MTKGPDPNQRKRFIEAARELGCDEDSAAFEKAFGQIVPPKREGDKAAPKTKKPSR